MEKEGRKSYKVGDVKVDPKSGKKLKLVSKSELVRPKNGQPGKWAMRWVAVKEDIDEAVLSAADRAKKIARLRRARMLARQAAQKALEARRRADKASTRS